MKDQYPEAETEFRQLLRPTSPPRNRAFGFTGIALLSVSLGRYEDAVTNIDQARDMAHGADAVHATLIGNVMKAFCSYAVKRISKKQRSLQKQPRLGRNPPIRLLSLPVFS